MINDRTFKSRVVRDGYTLEEAETIPANVPRWVWRIEQEIGRPFREFVEELASTGKPLSTVANQFDLPYDRVASYVRKWGIKFGWHNQHR